MAGLAGYAGAHAVEYFFIVDHRLGADRSTRSRQTFFLVYLSVFGALYLFVRSMTPPTVFTSAVLFFGGLHFLFDGFIWKRRPSPTHRDQPIAANVSA